MAKLGYLRVSKKEQRPDRQIDGLRDRCDRLFVEKCSAVSQKRPIYEATLRKLGAGDTLVLWDIDRAFRSTRDALNEAHRLMNRGVSLEIVSLPINMATAEGWLFYTIAAAFAEFERGVLIRRTREGMKSAKKRGSPVGRPPKLSARQLAQAGARIANKAETVASIARDLNVAPWTLSRAIKRQSLRASS